MQLYSLMIEGFRKHVNTTIKFSDSTFLIGENNAGKSSVLYALDYLLGANSKIPDEEYYTIEDETKGKKTVEQIVLTAEFRNIPDEAKSWRGFKGRLLRYETEEEDDTGLKFIYRKTYPKGGSVKIETLEHPKKLKDEYEKCVSIQDFLDAGLDESELPEEAIKIKYDKKLSQKDKSFLYDIDSLFVVDDSQECWIENPGGIPQNELSKLPKY